MSFEKFIEGVMRYLNSEVFTHIGSDWQEVLARIYVMRMFSGAEELKKTLMENPFLKTFALVDSSGMVDVNSVNCIMRDLKKLIEEKNNKLTIGFPLIGNFTFTSDDVAKLHKTILDGYDEY